MILSILSNWSYILGSSITGSEIVDISYEDFVKIQAKTHKLNIQTKELVAIPQPEPEPITEPTEEQIKEAKLQEMEKLILRKQAMELVGETVGSIADEIKQRADSIIELKDISKEEKIELKSSVMTKL